MMGKTRCWDMHVFKGWKKGRMLLLPRPQVYYVTENFSPSIDISNYKRQIVGASIIKLSFQ